MRLPFQLAIILSVCLAGECLHRFLQIPLPGNIIAMILLFLLLCFKIIKPHQIAQSTNFFLRFLPFFFLPAGVSILGVRDALQGQIFSIVFICILSAALGITATAHCVQFLNKLTGEGSIPIYKRSKFMIHKWKHFKRKRTKDK